MKCQSLCSGKNVISLSSAELTESAKVEVLNNNTVIIFPSSSKQTLAEGGVISTSVIGRSTNQVR